MNILFFDIGEIDYKGVELLSAILKKEGHRVDLLLDPGLGKHYYLKLPFLNNLISDKRLLDKAVSFHPDLIAMSIVTNNFMYFREFGRKLKKVMDVPIIVGGIHPTSLPEEVIKEDWVDIICVGDGEEAVRELADAMNNKRDISKIKNLWVKDKNGHIHRNELRALSADIDIYPMPDRSIYAQYGVLGRRIRFMTGRGCLHTCTFCVNSFRNGLYPGQKYLRKRSVNSVIEELRFVKSTYKAKAIRFEDDVFVTDKKWLREFKEEYTRYINLPFHCYFTPTGVNEEIIQLIKECGCTSIAMGIQSGNAEVRHKLMKRNYTNETVIRASEIIRKAGIKLYAEYMFGLPDETPEEMWETLLLTDKIKAHNSWAAIFYPYPKTDLMEYAMNNQFIDENVYKMIAEGTGSPHSSTILKHPFADEIIKFKILLPVYAAVPKIFKPLVIFLIKKKKSFLHELIFIISLPLLEKREFIYRIIRIPEILIKTYRVLKNTSNAVAK